MLALSSRVGLTVRRLSEVDAPLVQGLLDVSVDYYQLVYGEPARPDEGLNILTELPVGTALSDKSVFGFFKSNQQCVGVLDGVLNFRTEGEWYLGFLLLAPTARGQRRGSQILNATFDWLRSLGVRSVRLGCAEQNVAGRRFWEHHGFRVDKVFPPRMLGARQTVLLEYVRLL
ncbi:MAG: GNAT family N-acetyltransferase [Myxococcaceae bacterium]|nr:GNAT family N-acetyltransferase [Myxococcaceae bacterium]